jgi:hypothetical protein
MIHRGAKGMEFLVSCASRGMYSCSLETLEADPSNRSSLFALEFPSPSLIQFRKAGDNSIRIPMGTSGQEDGGSANTSQGS